jgi:choice-of-anchor A domain-containing protein
VGEVEQQSGIDFDQLKARLTTTSTQLCNAQSTGTTEVTATGAITMRGTGRLSEVISLSLSRLARCT